MNLNSLSHRFDSGKATAEEYTQAGKTYPLYEHTKLRYLA